MTQLSIDCKTGAVTEAPGDPSLLARLAEESRLLEIEAQNEAIRAQLRENDLQALRALFENDKALIAAHIKAQAILRAKLK